jgi:hypothetical protein
MFRTPSTRSAQSFAVAYEAHYHVDERITASVFM